MAIIGLVIAAAGAMALWLSGAWFGRLVAFIALAPAGCFIVVASPAFAGRELIGYAAAIGAAWLIAWLPMLLRPPQFVPVRVERLPDIALQLVRPHAAGKALQ